MSDAFHTGPFPLDLALTAVVDKLAQQGFHLHYGALNTPEQRYGDNGYDIGLSPLMDCLLNCFDVRADWFLGDLDSPPTTPEWHAIYISPTSPIPLDDDLLVADSESKALAYVLESICAVRARVDRVYRDSEGALVVSADVGPIATIQKIVFRTIPKPLLQRAEKALTGLASSVRGADYATAFKRLPGFGSNATFYDLFERFDLPLPESTDHDSLWGVGRPMLYPTCSNLATAIGRVLERLVMEPLPRHLVLELVSWRSW